MGRFAHPEQWGEEVHRRRNRVPRAVRSPGILLLATLLLLPLPGSLATARHVLGGSTASPHPIPVALPTPGIGSLGGDLGTAAPLATTLVSALPPLALTERREIPRGVALAHASLAAAPQFPDHGTPSSLAASWAPVHGRGVSVGLQMEGLDSTNCGCSPPDVQDAAGPTQVVEFVNLGGEVFNATTGSVVQSYTLSRFFGTGNDFLSDPRILYDTGSSRWYASILDVGSTAGTMLAVSASSNAVGSWTVYRIPTPSGYFGDQPILGLSSTLVGIGVTLYSLTNGAFGGGMYWVVNKTSAMGGFPLHYQGFGPDFSASSYHPVDVVTSSNALYMVMTTYGGSTSAIALFNITGVPPAAVTVHETNVSVNTITPAPSGQQPGTSVGIDTGDSRVQAALWRSGTLWVGFNDACQVTGSSSPRACFRVVEINTSTGSVLQDFDEGIANADLYYPAFALAPSGDLAIAFGMSSGSLYPSVEVTGQLSTDPAGTLQQPGPLVTGTSSMSCGGNPVCRYGDYFGASPSIGVSGTWVAGEYLGTNASWQTRLGHVQLFEATPRLSVNPIQVDVGQSVVVNLTLSNSPCTVAGGLYCTVSVPLGTGSPYSVTCHSPFVSASIPSSWSQPGMVEIGNGGYVDTYSSANCSPGSLVSHIPLSPLVVTVEPSPTVGLSISPAPGVEVGEQVTFQAVLAGGIAPYRFLWSALPSGCIAANTPQITCVLLAAGSSTVGVNVTDADSVTTSASAAVTVGAAPSVTVNLLPGELELGQSGAIVAMVQGGIGTIYFVWTELPAGCPVPNASLVNCDPSATGIFPISVTVQDSLGLQATSSAVSLAVVAPPSLTVSPSSSSVTQGDRASWTTTTHAGAGPFTYRWTGLPGGCSSSNSSALSCTPTAVGAFTVTVYVTDALGGNASARAMITVGSATPLGVATTVGIATVAAVAAALLAGFFLARRRRRRLLRDPTPGSGAPLGDRPGST